MRLRSLPRGWTRPLSGIQVFLPATSPSSRALRNGKERYVNSEREEKSKKAILRELDQATALGSAPCVHRTFASSGRQRFDSPVYRKADTSQPSAALSHLQATADPCQCVLLPYTPAVPKRSSAVPKP